MEIINGIGIDIVSKARIKLLKNKTRFLNKDELEFLSKLKDEDSKMDFISGRWASKEAIIKASNKKIKFYEISILNEDNGKPYVLFKNLKNDNIKISISHEKDYTVAFSIIINL
ncbi:MAG: holo-ACP synthase [Candidatus Tyloplasma litorale]|nr:MAG: holo-ACP synthase [Mycoplasmatales bacterium]